MTGLCETCIFWRGFKETDNDYGWGTEESTQWGVCTLAYGPQHRIGYSDLEYFVQIDEDNPQVQWTRAVGADDLPPMFVEDAAFHKAFLVTRRTHGCTEWIINPGVVF